MSTEYLIKTVQMRGPPCDLKLLFLFCSDNWKISKAINMPVTHHCVPVTQWRSQFTNWKQNSFYVSKREFFRECLESWIFRVAIVMQMHTPQNTQSINMERRSFPLLVAYLFSDIERNHVKERKREKWHWNTNEAPLIEFQISLKMCVLLNYDRKFV